MGKLDEYGKCPECGSDWDGGSIVDTFIKSKNEGDEYFKDKTDDEIRKHVAMYYGSETGRWSNLVGIELAYDDPNHYDGISFWRCPDCKATWDRFTGEKKINNING